MHKKKRVSLSYFHIKGISHPKTCYVSMLTVVILLLLFHHYSPFVFCNSDDFYINAVVSGALTGTPEAYMLHMHILTGLLLSSLYKLFPTISWYGIFLAGSIAISMYSFLCDLLKKCHIFLSKFLTWCFFIIVSSFIFTQYLLEIQYTTVAGVVCAAAILHFFSSDSSRPSRKYIWQNRWTLLLLGLSWCIRYKVTLMLLPFLFLLFLAKLIQDRKQWRNLAYLFICCSLLLFLLFMLDKIAYHNQVWNTFKSYNSNRETVMDYNGYPDYDTYQDLYETYGITRSSYEAASSHYEILLDDHINAQSMAALASASSTLSATTNTVAKLKTMASVFCERQLSTTDRPLSVMVFALYLSVIFLGLYRWLLGRSILILASDADKKMLLPSILALLIARMSIWFYILWIGRYPYRVTQCIYLVEFFILSALFLSMFPPMVQLKAKLSTYIFFGIYPIVCIGLLLSCFHVGFTKLQDSQQEVQASLSFSETYTDIQNYMDEHPENFYLCDTLSMSYFTEDIFTTENGHQHNRVLLGSWMAKSPWYNEIFEEYQLSDITTSLLNQPQVYLLVMNTSSTESLIQSITDYYQEAEQTNITSNIIDTVACRNNIQFYVVQFSKNS